MFHHVLTIKRSLIAFITTAILSVLTMGALGGALFYLVCPFLPAAFDNVDKLHGDWVWPLMIAAGLFWSPAFLLTGWLNFYLTLNTPLSGLSRKLIYGLLLWLLAVVAWYAALFFFAPAQI